MCMVNDLLQLLCTSNFVISNIGRYSSYTTISAKLIMLNSIKLKIHWGHELNFSIVRISSVNIYIFQCSFENVLNSVLNRWLAEHLKVGNLISNLFCFTFEHKSTQKRISSICNRMVWMNMNQTHIFPRIHQIATIKKNNKKKNNIKRIK